MDGDLVVHGGTLDRLEAGTTSGSIHCEAIPSERGSFELESMSGNVVLVVPRSLEADYELSTFSGQIKNQMREADKRFRDVGELSLLQFIKRFDGENGTKLAWLHHGIEQEMYHRGQLTLYIRMMGMEPAPTQRIRGG